MTEPTSLRIAVDSAEPHVGSAGAGDPLVLGHGGITDCRMWNPQMNAFALAMREHVTAMNAAIFARSDEQDAAEEREAIPLPSVVAPVADGR